MKHNVSMYYVIAAVLVVVSAAITAGQWQHDPMVIIAVAAHLLTAILMGWGLRQQFAARSADGEDWQRKLAQLEADKGRIERSFASLTTNVMVADNDLRIQSVNASLLTMLKSHETALRQSLPEFNTATLIGTNIDVFHVNPSHQRRLISELRDVYRAEIEVAGLAFGLVVTPLFDGQGQREGTMVEWHDLTLQRQQKIQAQENARMKVALDNVSTNVMLADNDCNIIYFNESMRDMMRDNLSTFRLIRDDFDPENLIGKNIDIFHKDPSHQRKLLTALKDTYRTQIQVGNIHFALTANPVVDEEGNRLGTTLEWEDVTQQRAAEHQAKENARIRAALDSVTTNVMVADGDLDIVYMNEAVQTMLRAAANDLRKELPQFDPDRLIGENIDKFHKDPSHQRGMLAKLERPYRTQIQVGQRRFTLIATPVVDEDNQRLGTVVEWADVTAQHETESEVQKLVSSVSQGQLGALIRTDNKEGFFLNVSNGLNELSQTVNAFVRDINDALQQVAQGDMRVTITNDYQGMFGDVKTALNNTTQHLSSVIGSIKTSADSIRSANHELSLGNDQLSERTEKQASNLEETAASLEQLTGNVRSTADNATTANSAAEKARQQANQGELIVTEAVQAMGEITESSNKISAIIGVIDEIAFQTNLLALNASVEAARAGEQGRGFAVVANEVRNLAQRSATSAREIKGLIDDSSVKVGAGSDLVNRCGESLRDILTNVDQLSALIADIANATNEQASGIGQVNQAVAELDDITQQNAALAEQASAASQSSVQQVDEMVDRIAFFTVEEGQTSAPAVAPVAAKPKVVSRQPATTPKPAAPPATKKAGVDMNNDEEWEEF
ncbi:methyl-accepting chemotaxis protein [Aestuariibacter halophilus]|uniref:Methyl-accepting chemotaxis protein n=1 Tax=Fluctibacter halophilus TaxID=226011 RepID=A0ABS8G610_9ALTE|nr:methyl-accepting chemotaxis protein [Aestuariibacter halophilus]MCC2616034.1 methyl-accepting chemotaxis protein [Aestuariibacter halophilus]